VISSFGSNSKEQRFIEILRKQLTCMPLIILESMLMALPNYKNFLLDNENHFIRQSVNEMDTA
jgi:hypothetical protein